MYKLIFHFCLLANNGKPMLSWFSLYSCLEQNKTKGKEHGKFIVLSKRQQEKLPSCQNIVLSESTMAFNKLNCSRAQMKFRETICG